MTVGYALAIKRLYGAGIVRVAAKHNLREIAAELGADGHIDAARIADNFTLRGPATADGVAQLAKSLMESAGVTKCRKTAVMALELLFTLPPSTGIDPRQYFEQATTWAEQHFGVPVLSCVVHLDEGAPHAHALLLPLVDGRMGGSDLHGGKAKLWAMQTDFHTQVGAQYGFARQTPTKRHSTAARAAGMAMLRDCFQTNTAMSDAAINVLLKPHAKDPEPLLVALGFVMPAAKAHAKGSFVAIMTAPCKPEPRNPIGKVRRNPIGEAILEAAPESQPYTCVGIAFPTAPFPSQSEPQPSASNQPMSESADQVRASNQQASTGTAQPSAAPGQQASARSATGQPTTDQQRERSTTSIEQCGTDTGNPASPATAARGQNGTDPLAISQPADNPVTLPDWVMAPRTTASPGKAGMALSTVGSTVEAIAAERSQHHAHQQVGQKSDHDAGLASTAPTKRAATKRQAKTVTAAAPARPAGTTPKRKRAAGKVASTTSTTSTPATAHHQAASIEQSTASPAGQVATAKTRKRTGKIAASTSPSPHTSTAGIAPAADQAGHQQDRQHRAHAIEEQAAPDGRPQTGDAGIEVTVDTPAKRSTAKGIVPADDTRAGQPAVSAAAPACQHLASNDDVTPRNAKASQAASARRAKTSTATPASAPAAPRTGKRSSTASRPAATPLTPSTSASTRSTSSMATPSTSTPKPKRTAMLQHASGTPAYATVRQATSSKPALGKGQYDADADQPDEIRRLADGEQAATRCARSTSSAAPAGLKPGNSRNYRNTNQPNEIRTLGLAACSSMSNASTAPTMRDALKLQPISPASGNASQSAEISAQCSWPKFSGQQHSPEYSGQLQVDQQASQRAGEDDRHGAPALDWLPMPAPRINDSATARPVAQAGIAAHLRHQSPAPVIEQGLLQGGASTDTDLGPRQGEQLSTTAKPAAPGIEQHQQPAHAQRTAGIKGRLQGRAFDGTDLAQHHQHGLAPLSNADDYERVSDDAQAAELWDGDLGEFVKAPAKATRRDARTPAGPTLATWSTYCMRLDLRR